MRPRGAALAESAAAAMGGTAADGVGEFEREGVRRVVPDGRADAADGRVCESEAVGPSATVSCPAKAGHPVLRAHRFNHNRLGVLDRPAARAMTASYVTTSSVRTTKSHANHKIFSC